MVNMTDIFGNALSIAGSFMDSDLVNRFMMVIFAERRYCEQTKS